MKTSQIRWFAVIALLGIVAWLVAHWPHTGLWYDEALTTYVATDSWSTLFRWCTQVDIQVPFHYIVLRLWVTFLGDSEFAVRLLSVCSIILTSAGLIALGRRLTKSEHGLIAALLLALTPGMLWIAYEVRAYALALALYTWATVFLCSIINRALKQRSIHWPTVIAYSLLMLATLYSHYTALAGFAAHIAIIVIIALVQRSKRLGQALAAILILVVIGFSPWLPILLTRSTADRSYYVGAPILPAHAIQVMLDFKLQGIDDIPAANVPLVFGYIALMGVGLVIATAAKRYRAVLTSLIIAAVPVIATAAIVYFKPKLAGRYAWPAWIGFDMLVAAIIATLIQRWRIIGIGALALIIALPWTIGERGGPPDSDFRGAFAYLCTHGTPDDAIILRDGTLFVEEQYYGRRAPCSTERYTVQMPEALLTNVDQALTLPDAQNTMTKVAAHHPPNVWVIAWQGDVMDPQGLAYGLLDGMGNHSQQMFGDVRLDWFQNPQPITGDPVALAKPINVTPVPGGPTLLAMRLIAPDHIHVGDTVVLQAWWQKGQTLQPDLRINTQIIKPDGSWTYRQIDQPPAGYKYVDDRWQTDVPALGRYEFTIGLDMPDHVKVRYLIYDKMNRWNEISLDIGDLTVERP